MYMTSAHLVAGGGGRLEWHRGIKKEMEGEEEGREEGGRKGLCVN